MWKQIKNWHHLWPNCSMSVWQIVLRLHQHEDSHIKCALPGSHGNSFEANWILFIESSVWTVNLMKEAAKTFKSPWKFFRCYWSIFPNSLSATQCLAVFLLPSFLPNISVVIVLYAVNADPCALKMLHLTQGTCLITANDLYINLYTWCQFNYPWTS